MFIQSSFVLIANDFLRTPYISLVAAILNFLLAVSILTRNPRGTLNRVYAFAALSIFWWGSAEFMERSSETLAQGLLWERLSSFGYIAAPLLQCWFAFYFVGVSSLNRKIVMSFFSFFSALAGALIWLTPLIISRVQKYEWGFAGVAGELFPFLVTLFFVEMGLVIFMYVKIIMTTDEVQKRFQAILLCVGALLPATVGLYTDGVLPMIGKGSTLELATLTMTLTILLVALAMVRYGFLGIGIEIAAPFVLATLADAVLIIGDHGRIVYVNRATPKLVGAEENTLLAMRVQDILPELPPEALTTFFMREGILKTSQGVRVPVRILIQRVADLTTGIRGNVVMLHDLTEIKKLQEKEAHARGEIEAMHRGAELIESAAEGIFSVDTDGKVNLWNMAMANITGIATDVILGKDVADGVHIIHKTRGPVAIREIVLDKVFAQKKPLTISFLDGYFLLKNEERIAVALTAAPLFHTNGDLFGVAVIVNDETKEFKADRIKSEFVSIASHQLRTPLSTVKWFSEMLLDGDAGKMDRFQTAFVQDILTATNRVIEIVNMLLNISRMEEETLAVIPELTDLVKLLEAIVAEIQPDVEHKGISILFHKKDAIPLMNIDPRLIRFVFENLINNAVRYSVSGGEIVVTVSKDASDVQISVADQGYGIPPAEQKRIFEKFFRASNAKKAVQNGTGLGLFIAKAAVELSGGTIFFTSEENKGSTFTFTLPLSGSVAKDGTRSLT